MAIPGITDSLIATLLWATGNLLLSVFNDPLKQALRDTEKRFKDIALPFPVDRIGAILSGKADPDILEKFRNTHNIQDSKALALALLDFEGTISKEVPENLENAISCALYC